MKKKKTYSRSGFGVKKDLFVEGEIPKWIKDAKRKENARIRYYVKRYGWTKERAEAHLTEKSEESMQEK